MYIEININLYIITRYTKTTVHIQNQGACCGTAQAGQSGAFSLKERHCNAHGLQCGATGHSTQGMMKNESNIFKEFEKGLEHVRTC